MFPFTEVLKQMLNTNLLMCLSWFCIEQGLDQRFAEVPSKFTCNFLLIHYFGLLVPGWHWIKRKWIFIFLVFFFLFQVNPPTSIQKKSSHSILWKKICSENSSRGEEHFRDFHMDETQDCCTDSGMRWPRNARNCTIIHCTNLVPINQEPPFIFLFQFNPKINLHKEIPFMALFKYWCCCRH